MARWYEELADEAIREIKEKVWDEAYAQGIADERDSQDYDGGWTKPARENPYRKDQ